jgi:hypothetical protein
MNEAPCFYRGLFNQTFSKPHISRMNSEFDLEHQYQLYLKRVALDESAMGDRQKIETKRAFMGACGQLLLLLRNDVSMLPEKEAVKVFDRMLNQVGAYWQAQRR